MSALILALPSLEYWLEFWWVFPIALGICIAVCVVGISGGVLFVPLFAVGFPALGIPLTAVQAVQIGMFTEIFGFSSSTVAFWRNDLIDVRTAGYSLLFAIPLAVVGGLLSNVLPGAYILGAVSVVMLVFSYLLYEAPAEDEANSQDETPQDEQPTQSNPSELGDERGNGDDPQVEHRDAEGRVYRYRRQLDKIRAASMTLGGLFEGLVGFSVGEIGVTERVLRNVPIRVAIGTNHLVILGAATAASLTHVTVVLNQGGQIPWNILVMTVPAVLIGGQLAGWLAGRVSENVLRHFLAGFLIILALITGGRVVITGEVSALTWILLAAVLLVVGVAALSLWNGRELKAKFCYASGSYYCE